MSDKTTNEKSTKIDTLISEKAEIVTKIAEMHMKISKVNEQLLNVGAITYEQLERESCW